jgi:hypothetical protein
MNKNNLTITSASILTSAAFLFSCNAAAPKRSKQEPSAQVIVASAPSPFSSPLNDIGKNEPSSQQQTIFAVEAPIARPVPLPESVVKALMLDERNRRILRTAEEFAKAFAASEVDLNGDNLEDIVVQAVNPKLLGANVDPFWLFRKSGKNYKLVLAVSALGLEILQQKTRGYRDIRASQATAKELFTTTFKYDGSRYVQAATSRLPLGEQ